MNRTLAEIESDVIRHTDTLSELISRVELVSEALATTLAERDQYLREQADRIQALRTVVVAAIPSKPRKSA